MSDDSMGWAPDVCTLPTAQQPLRVAEFDQLFTGSVRSSERVAPTHLRLTLAGPPGLRARVEDLAARENECCSFFDFAVGAGDEGGVRFDIKVPTVHVDVLDALAARAAAVVVHGRAS